MSKIMNIKFAFNDKIRNSLVIINIGDKITNEPLRHIKFVSFSSVVGEFFQDHVIPVWDIHYDIKLDFFLSRLEILGNLLAKTLLPCQLYSQKSV